MALRQQLMLEVVFDREQSGDEQQKYDQYAVTAFVHLIVKRGVPFVHNDRGDDEAH